jgi:hypothetical protein
MEKQSLINQGLDREMSGISNPDPVQEKLFQNFPTFRIIGPNYLTLFKSTAIQTLHKTGSLKTIPYLAAGPHMFIYRSTPRFKDMILVYTL